MKYHPIPHSQFSYPIGVKISHNEKIFNNLCQEFIKIAEHDLLTRKKIYLIGTGSSGSIISTFMYFHLVNHFPHLQDNIVITHIKKENETSHANRCDGLPNKYKPNSEEMPAFIWLDDHINGGYTANYCLHEIRKHDFHENTYKDFRFDWAVCISSEYSRNKQLQLDFFEKITHNMVCHIDTYCEGGQSGMAQFN